MGLGMAAQSGRPRIPVFRPDISEEVITAVAETLRSRWIGPGPKAAQFEKAFAGFAGAEHAVSTSTGTAALKAALAVLGVGPGDEVVIPSFTWISIFQVVRELGATPVFADIEPDHLTIDPSSVANQLTGRTKCIVAVHHGGQLCDLDSLELLAADEGVYLVIDAAHACGARYRSRPVGGPGPTATCFSFNAMKNLAIGDGGMITTQHGDLARRLKIYRSLGIDRDTYARYGAANSPRGAGQWRYDVVSAGERIHMNDIAAAAGLVQLSRLPEGNRRRAAIAQRYRAELAGIPGLRLIGPRPATEPSWHMSTVLTANRAAFMEAMAERGVQTSVHYQPIHLFPFCSVYSAPLPVTEELWRQVVTLPMFAELSGEDQSYVIGCVRESAAPARARGASQQS